MISSPQSDFIHSFHVGVAGETFGDMTCLKTVESNSIEQKSNDEQTSSLFDEVMQAFTEIYSDSNNRSSTHDEHSSSSNHEKSDSHSYYSSVSSLNSRSSSINKGDQQQQQQHPVTGQPLPPPPDLSSLGSKLTTATMTQTFKLPESLISNKYRTKKRFNPFA